MKSCIRLNIHESPSVLEGRLATSLFLNSVALIAVELQMYVFFKSK